MLPVLIIPGIMSSGLEVKMSGVSDRHIGERVWINPVALGFCAVYMGRALEMAEKDDKKSAEKTNNEKKKKDAKLQPFKKEDEERC